MQMKKITRSTSSLKQILRIIVPLEKGLDHRKHLFLEIDCVNSFQSLSHTS